MSWPAKLRTYSYFITLVVVLSEFATAAIPIGVVIWLIGLVSAIQIARIGSALGLLIALIIATQSHVRPPRVRTRALKVQNQ